MKWPVVWTVRAALVGLAAWSAWTRWRLLGASPFPVGIDGYFYAIQEKALLAHGHLAYPASPLAFWLLAPFAAALGPIAGVKLGAAVLGGLSVVPAYGVGARLGGSRGAGLVAAAVCAVAPGSLYLSVEFVKNGIGLGVALAAIWLGLRAIDRTSASPFGDAAPSGKAGRCEPPSRGRIVAAVLAFAAAVATHKMAGGLAALILAPAWIVAARRRWLVAGGLAAAALVVLAIGLFAPHRVLSFDDAPLAGGLFSAHLAWSAPVLDGLPLGYAALLGGLGALAVVALGTRAPRDPVAAAALAVLALAIFLALPILDIDDRQGLAFRLRIAAFVPAALVGAILVGRIARVVPARLAAARAIAAGAIAAAVFAIGAATTGDLAPGEITVHPAMVTAAAALRIPPGDTAVLSERQVAFLVAWTTGAPVSLHPEAVPRERRVRVITRAFIGDQSHLYAALVRARELPEPPVGVHPLDANGLVLVPEAAWDWCLAQLPPDERAAYAGWPVR
ncbi:MAG TPA: glycosyltransferase family 39 protein [Kofleriaceae bacterium]